MTRAAAEQDDLTVLRCWGCGGDRYKCRKCAGTGSVFWVEGRAFPYSPEGEKRARGAVGRGK